MEPTATDDRIQAVVDLVLHAVDDRLAILREQLLQVAQRVEQQHVELSEQVSTQLTRMSNLLDDKVTLIEARLLKYTDERFAELVEPTDTHVATGDRWAPPASVTGEHPSVQPAHQLVDHAVPQSAPFPILTPALTLIRNDAPAAPLTNTAAPVEPIARPVVEELDPTEEIARLSAQMSARLSAAVDRAIGGTVTPHT